jgi:hypothetical protein
MKPLSDSGYIGCVFSTVRNVVSSTKKLTALVPRERAQVNLTVAATRVRDRGIVFNPGHAMKP